MKNHTTPQQNFPSMANQMRLKNQQVESIRKITTRGAFTRRECADDTVKLQDPNNSPIHSVWEGRTMESRRKRVRFATPLECSERVFRSTCSRRTPPRFMSFKHGVTTAQFALDSVSLHVPGRNRQSNLRLPFRPDDGRNGARQAAVARHRHAASCARRSLRSINLPALL